MIRRQRLRASRLQMIYELEFLIDVSATASIPAASSNGHLMHILIIGGGICGLGTALLLALDGHEVTGLAR
jgi:hypothetical protein